MSGSQEHSLNDFRRRCREHGLAFTHQRQVIYETITSSREHPTPEWIYERVRKRIPSISLGTIYKNVKTFLDTGILKEVTLHHGTLRLESNMAPHHHVVCSTCKAIFDIEESAVEPVKLAKGKAPAGFAIAQCRVEFVGQCQRCRTGASQRKSS
jgi:Fur family transcriptional regulator, peroxide stress response regulator